MNAAKALLLTGAGLAAGAGILVALLVFAWPIQLAEQQAADIRIAFLSPPMKSRSDIVIVAINETTLEQFPYRAPVDREFLAQLLLDIQTRGAKAVGVDLLFDQPTEPSKDLALAALIRGLKIPAVVAYSRSKKMETDSQQAYENAFVTPTLRGLTDIYGSPYGPAHVFRPKQKLEDGSYIYSFAGLLVKKMGHDVGDEPTAVAWRRPDPDFFTVSAHLVHFFPPSWFRGKIVMVGLITSDTELSPQTTLLPDRDIWHVQLQAQELATLLDGPATPTWPSWLMGVLTILGLVACGLLVRCWQIPLWKWLLFGWAAVAAYWFAATLIWWLLQIMLPVVIPTIGFLVGALATAAIPRRQTRAA
jgi:adenylate cyclase